MPVYVTSTIKPTGSFPTFEDVDGYGGLQVRATLSDINNIPSANRKVGMLAYSVADGYFYQLTSLSPLTWSVAGFNANKLQGKEVSSVSPTDGQVLVWNNTAGKWEAQSATGISGSIELAQDLGNTAELPKVIGIQGYSVDSAPPGDGYTFFYDTSTTSWKPTQFLDKSVSPSDGYVLLYSSGKWKPQPSSAISLSDATNSVKGVVRLTNDFGGTATSPKVTGIQGNPVNSASPGDGYVMLFKSSEWKPTQFLDTSVTPSDGYVLLYNGSSGKWKPQPASTISVSDATSAVKGIIQLAGDLNAGSASSPQVTGLLGKQIDSTVTLADGYVMLYNSATNQWKPQSSSVISSFDITSFSAPITTFEYGATATPTFSYSLSYTPTSLSIIDPSLTTTTLSTTSTSYSSLSVTTSVAPTSISETKKVTLSATFNGITKTKDVNLTWTFNVYYGVGDAWSSYNTPALKTNFINTLTKKLQSSRSVSYTPTSTELGSGKYVYYLCPASYGNAIPFANGLQGGMGAFNILSGVYEQNDAISITVNATPVAYKVYYSDYLSTIPATYSIA